jgi:hypothetical protein
MHINTRSPLATIATTAGLTLYTYDGYRNTSLSVTAERQTEGKTHYFDADTRKCFHSVVVSIETLFDGVALAVIEKTALDYENSKRGFRVVIIDLDGEVILRRSLETAHKTLAAAQKALVVEIEALNGVDILRAVLERKAKRAERELGECNAALLEISK